MVSPLHVIMFSLINNAVSNFSPQVYIVIDVSKNVRALTYVSHFACRFTISSWHLSGNRVYKAIKVFAYIHEGFNYTYSWKRGKAVVMLLLTQFILGRLFG